MNNDIVHAFKQYLFTQKKQPSKITIKNYVSDVRKFVTWYQELKGDDFDPSILTYQLISQYQGAMSSTSSKELPAASSAKRYISSLKRFSAFLIDQGLLDTDPFAALQKPQKILDPFYLKEFKNFLYIEHASKLTIKNYITDIKQFLNWFGIVMNNTSESEFSKLLILIDNNSLEQYKIRLYNEAKLSPISINRKLSSLRKYIRWLKNKGILSIDVVEPEVKKQQAKLEAVIVEEPKPSAEIKSPFISIPQEIPLTALQNLPDKHEKEKKKSFSYSSFPPIRLFQKTSGIITLGTDLLLFNPIAQAAEAIHYLLWKSGKKIIFAPVSTFLEDTIPSETKAINAVKSIIPKATSILPPRSANISPVIDRFKKYGSQTAQGPVQNFKKNLYAPLEISTKHMHWQEKLVHTLRYVRPNWYKKYHTYPFVNYLHFAIMTFVAVFSSMMIYQTWQSNPSQNQAVLAAHAIAPPRTISFQGRLLDNNNNPITAETSLRFTLYNSPTASGEAMLWQETQDIKPNTNGSFDTTLGLKSRIEQSLFTDNPSLYVGVTVGTNQELSPRQQIPTTSYAADSQSVQGLKPITDTPNSAQNVLLALDSSGNLTIGGTESHTFQATGGQMSLSGKALLLTTNPDTSGNITISPDGSGIIDLQKPIQNTSNNITPGGIQGAVEVDDILSVFTKSSTQSALVINQNGSGDIISGRTNGIDRFRVDSYGNELVGGDIILNGDTIGTNSTMFDIAGTNVTNLTIGNNASVLSLGGSTGVTTINNSLSVHGKTVLTGDVTISGALTANAGITVPDGQKVTLANFSNGAIPFIDGNSQIVQDAATFAWDEANKKLNVTGALCIQDATGSCGSTPGTIYATNTTVQSADLAENYVSSQYLKPGDLVIPEGQGNNMAVIKSTMPYQPQLIGIISTKPGITLNSSAKTDPQHPYIYPLALQGRVPVNVSTINGPIEAGDPLTSSSIPGVAMKATQSGQIVGKALESYTNANPQAVGQIMVFVNLSYQNYPMTITDSGSITVANNPAIQDNVATINSFPDVLATTSASILNQIASTSATPTSSSSSATVSVANNYTSPSATIYNSIASDSAQINSDLNTIATSSASNTIQNSSNAASLDTSPFANNFDTQSITNTQYEPVASLSSQLSYIPNFKTDLATVTQGLIALGPTSLSDTSISTTLDVGNNLKITSDTINTIGSDLNIQPLRQGNILFMGGLVAIDTQGNLKVNGDATFVHNATVNGELAAGIIAPVPDQDLVIDLKNKSDKSNSSLIITSASGSSVLKINQTGDLASSGEATFKTVASNGFTIIRGAEADTSNIDTESNNSAGTGVISPYETQRTIFTPYVTAHSLIYVTATSNTGSATPFLARQTLPNSATGTQGSFTVAIPTQVATPVSFNWWIVN